MNRKAVLSQVEVSRILVAARTEAQANQWPVTIVVVDDGGHPWPSNASMAPRPSAPTSLSKKPVLRPWGGANPKAMKRWSMAGARPFCRHRC